MISEIEAGEWTFLTTDFTDYSDLKTGPNVGWVDF
jgi:hypothetical protein